MLIKTKCKMLLNKYFIALNYDKTKKLIKTYFQK